MAKTRKATANTKKPVKKTTQTVKKPAPKKKAPAAAKPRAKKAASRKASSRVLITGFPGLVAQRIAAGLTAGNRNLILNLLVQPERQTAAKQALAELGLTDQCVLLSGDVAAAGFGLDEKTLADLKRETREVWHLAAIDEIAAAEQPAWRVNVEGTQHLLDLCETMIHLEKLVYFSTCFVSGLREGLIREDELEYGQGFKNHFESTRFEGEALVQKRRTVVPTVIIRSGFLVGDTRTGRIDQGDGPNHLIRSLARAKQEGKLARYTNRRLPSFGKGAAYLALTPIDYLTTAALHIAAQAGAIGRNFHLCDPDPLTAREFTDAVLTHFGLAPSRGVLPLSLLKPTASLTKLGELLQVPDQWWPYVDHYTVYDCKNALAFLKDSDINCPHLSEYLGALLDFAAASSR